MASAQSANQAQAHAQQPLAQPGPVPMGQMQPVPQQYRRYSPTTMAETNAFAMISIILAFLQPIAGIVFGHIALGQIKRNGDSGRGLALAGVIISYILVSFVIIFVILYITLILAVIATAASSVRA